MNRDLKPFKSEVGSVVGFVVIVLAILIVGIAFIVDYGIIVESRSQQRRSAEVVAASALEAFLLSAQVDPEDKLEDARARAQAVSGQNIGLQKNFLVNTAAAHTLVHNLDTSANYDASNGLITPGIWYKDDPGCSSGGLPSPCPCDSGWQGPCFRPIEVDTEATPPNAMHVELKQQVGNPLSTIFARVFGYDTQTTRDAATVAVINKHVIFIPDVSRSSHVETHVPMAFGSPVPTCFPFIAFTMLQSFTEYAYNFNDPMPANCGDCLTPGACTFEGGDSDTEYDIVWQYNILGWTGPSGISHPFAPFTRATDICNPSPQSDRNQHYADEFTCHAVPFNDSFSSRSEEFLIDQYCQDGALCEISAYDGPEPLNSIFHGIYTGLNLITEADKAGFQAIDGSARVDVRNVPLSKNNDVAFVGLQNALNVEAPSLVNFQGRINMGLFPIDPGLNLPQALTDAHAELAADPSFEVAESSVILFTDGVTTCPLSGSHSDCSQDFPTFSRSMEETIEIIRSNYQQDDLPLNVIHVGRNAQPHTLLRRGLGLSDNKCMTQEEATELDMAFVAPCPSSICPDPDSCTCDPATNQAALDQLFSDSMTSTSADPFVLPAQLFDEVRKTGGLWFPIRPPCDPGAAGFFAPMSQGQCEAGQLEAALDTACGAATDPGDIIDPAGVTDGNGRLTCDPRCRNSREQIEAAVEEILKRKPYAVVE